MVAPLLSDMIKYYPKKIKLNTTNRELKPVEQLILAIPPETYKYVIESDIIKKIQDNIKIGVSVTESINLVSSAALRNPIMANGVEIKNIPLASILNPLGTVLHGPLSTATYTDQNGNVVPMKLKLELFFTKPN